MNLFNKIFPLFMGTLCVAVFALFGCMVWNELHSVCVRRETIVRVNGCNWQGNCGWVTENYQGFGSSPVEGARVCVERKEPFPWLR